MQDQKNQELALSDNLTVHHAIAALLAGTGSEVLKSSNQGPYTTLADCGGDTEQYVANLSSRVESAYQYWMSKVDSFASCLGFKELKNSLHEQVPLGD